MDSEELKNRTKQFAHRCVKLATALPQTPIGDHIRRQLIRCSTSVAANYRAVCLAKSRPDFASKLSTVLEEVDESCFWMEFIVEENVLNTRQVSSILAEAEELRAIFISSRRTVTKDHRC